jgi:hypothetical protein
MHCTLVPCFCPAVIGFPADSKGGGEPICTLWHRACVVDLGPAS